MLDVRDLQYVGFMDLVDGLSMDDIDDILRSLDGAHTWGGAVHTLVDIRAFLENNTDSKWHGYLADKLKRVPKDVLVCLES
jgi:hypothetical protein